MWKDFIKRLKKPDSLVSLFLGVAVVVVTGALIFNYLTGKRQGAGGQKEPEKKQEATISALPASHTVIVGETLWSIAEKYYKIGYNWVDIQEANSLVNPDYLEVGQVLTVPNVPMRVPAGDIAATSFEVARPRDGKYTVQRGDTLWGISLRTYGSGFRWVEIARANNLANPDIIHAGNVFVLP